MLIVQRRYPTFVDMIAKFGGMSRVITFVIFTIVSVHHLVVMEQYLINEAILQKKRNQATQGSRQQHDRSEFWEAQAFSYLEILRLKFLFFCIKKSERLKVYREFVGVIRERMDA